jgi:mono/diheme cytochrome c family protein
MKARIALWLVGLLVAAAAAGAGYVWSGVYNIAATRQHTQAVYSLLETTARRSVKLRAAQLTVPALSGEPLLARGASCYVQKCAQCHGGPGVAPSEIGRSMQPLPGPLVDASVKWTPAELYWITRNGIKMSGMPAWQHRMQDADLWAVVGFLQRLPVLTAAEFRVAAAAAQAGLPCEATAPVPGSAPRAPPDAERGRAATTQYACNACHRIPGVTGADVAVGPPLAGFAARRLVAGVVNNTTEHLVQWIRDPQSIDPETTMPNLQVSDPDARDIAAYLMTLR